MLLQFKTIAFKWLDYYKSVVKQNTWESHRHRVEIWVLNLGDKELKKITVSDIRKVINELYYSKNYAKDTLRKLKDTVSLILDYALEIGAVEVNVAKSVKIPKQASKRKRPPLTPNQFNTVLNNRFLKPFGPYALFLVLTGCRPSEPLALTTDDFLFEERLIRINKTVVYLRGNEPQIEYKLKTDINEKYVPMVDLLYEVLLTYKGHKGYIFGDENGELLTRRQVVHRWKQYQNDCQMFGTRYNCRHTFSLLCKRADIDPLLHKLYMGHSSVATSYDIYTQLDLSDIQEGVPKLNDYLNQTYLKSK